MNDKNIPQAPDADAPQSPARRRVLGTLAIAGAALATGCGDPAMRHPVGGSAAATSLDTALQRHIRRVVVIFLENRSFNNLFADFPGLEQPLSALPPERLLQRDRDGRVLAELPRIWKGLVPYRQFVDGHAYQIEEDAITGLPNAPWLLRTPDGKPLPQALVTNSPIHVFYRNQMQINGGRNDMFARVA